jgi:PAS domain-containing protein
MMAVIDTTFPEQTAVHNVRDFDHRAEGIAILDANGTICYLNTAWKQMPCAHKFAQLAEGENFFEMLNAAFDPTNQANLDALHQSVQRLLLGTCDSLELEYPYCHGDKQCWFLVQMHRYPLSHGWGVLVQQSAISQGLHSRTVGASMAY